MVEQPMMGVWALFALAQQRIYRAPPKAELAVLKVHDFGPLAECLGKCAGLRSR